MAGSFGHITDDAGQFIGIALIENLGDAYEALEECFGMIHVLSGGDPNKIEDARRRYREGLESGGINKNFEDDEDDEDDY